MPATVMNAAGVINSPAAAFVPVGLPVPGKVGKSFEDIFSAKLNTSRDMKTDIKTNLPEAPKTEKLPNRSGPAEKPDVNADSSNEIGTEKPLLKTDENGIQKGEAVSEKLEETSAQPAEETTVDAEDENVESILATIMAQIAQLLEITVNELQGSFEEKGIDPAELLEGKDVSQLILKLVGGNDMTDMLVDGDLLETFNEIAEIIEENVQTDEQPILIDDRERISFAEIESVGKEKGRETELGKAAAGLTSKIEDPEVREAVDKAFEEPTVKTVTVNTEGSEDAGNREGFLREDAREDSGTRTKTGRDVSKTQSAETFVRNITYQQGPAIEELTYSEGVTVREIVYQLVDSIKVNISEDNTSLQMQLTPENLGRVNLSISSKNGVMTAQIATENETAREAIESQLQLLKQAIEDRGIRVEAIEVTVSGFNFDDSNNSGKSEAEEVKAGKIKGHRHISLDAADEEEERIIGEKLEKEVMIQQGSTVNFVA